MSSEALSKLINHQQEISKGRVRTCIKFFNEGNINWNENGQILDDSMELELFENYLNLAQQVHVIANVERVESFIFFQYNYQHVIVSLIRDTRYRLKNVFFQENSKYLTYLCDRARETRELIGLSLSLRGCRTLSRTYFHCLELILNDENPDIEECYENLKNNVLFKQCIYNGVKPLFNLENVNNINILTDIAKNIITSENFYFFQEYHGDVFERNGFNLDSYEDFTNFYNYDPILK